MCAGPSGSEDGPAAGKTPEMVTHPEAAKAVVKSQSTQNHAKKSSGSKKKSNLNNNSVGGDPLRHQHQFGSPVVLHQHPKQPQAHQRGPKSCQGFKGSKDETTARQLHPVRPLLPGRQRQGHSASWSSSSSPPFGRFSDSPTHDENRGFKVVKSSPGIFVMVKSEPRPISAPTLGSTCRTPAAKSSAGDHHSRSTCTNGGGEGQRVGSPPTPCYAGSKCFEAPTPESLPKPPPGWGMQAGSGTSGSVSSGVKRVLDFDDCLVDEPVVVGGPFGSNDIAVDPSHQLKLLLKVRA